MTQPCLKKRYNTIISSGNHSIHTVLLGFVFKILFSSIHVFLFRSALFYNNYVLFVCASFYVYKYVYSWAYCPMYKEINYKILTSLGGHVPLFNTLHNIFTV